MPYADLHCSCSRQPVTVEDINRFWATVCKAVRPMLSDRCPVCPICVSVPVYCRQTVGWIKMKLGMEVGYSPGHIVLDGDPAPPPQKKGGTASQFSAHVCWGQTAGWIKMPLGTEVGLDPGDIVLGGDPAPPRKGHSSPPPSFRPLSIVAIWSRISATAEQDKVQLDAYAHTSAREQADFLRLMQ